MFALLLMIMVYNGPGLGETTAFLVKNATSYFCQFKRRHLQLPLGSSPRDNSCIQKMFFFFSTVVAAACSGAQITEGVEVNIKSEQTQISLKALGSLSQFLKYSLNFAAGLHKLWYPGIRDMSTWSKLGAHGEHGDVFLFSNLSAL